ncbi:MAG: ZIP family metal transporter [Bacteroidia bacterium]
MMTASFIWGLISGSALILGAFISLYTRLPRKLIAAVMAYGSGVLISTLSFELIDEAYTSGGIKSTAIGFLSGATFYTICNLLLVRRGAGRRKHSAKQVQENEQKGSGMAIALGSIMDGIPESIVIGLSFLQGKGVSYVTVIAIFLSNIPESLSSATGMKNAGRTKKYILFLWTAICILMGLSALAGYAVFSNFSAEANAATMSVAAGAILAMISDTMIPEAFHLTRNFTGLIIVAGFLTAYLLSKMSH